MQDDLELAALIALRRTRQRRRRPRRRILLAGALIAAAVTAGVVGAAAVTGRALVLGSCDLHQLRPLELGENSFLFASDGSLLGVIPSRRNRQPLKIAQI